MGTQEQSLMRYATYASVGVAIAIVSIKFIAWLMTGSLSLMASLTDSVLDVMSSVINLMAVGYALKPADEDHRFGHGKAEDIAAFAQSAFISGSALFIAVEAVRRIIEPRVVENIAVGVWVMVVSIALTLGLIAFQSYVIKRTHSKVVQADALHYTTDLLVNGLVIIALLLSQYVDAPYLDPIFGIVIAVYIFKSAWKLGREAFDHLMDKEFDGDLREKIMKNVLACEQVRGIHDLRTRTSGVKNFVQLHIELDPKLSLKKAHDVGESVEDAVHSILPEADVLVHLDPFVKKDIDLIKNRVMSVKP